MQGGDEREEANEQLAGALCALAERLLGDAEELDSVAAECQQLLDTAQQLFPDSPEPLQVHPRPRASCSKDAHDVTATKCALMASLPCTETTFLAASVRQQLRWCQMS